MKKISILCSVFLVFFMVNCSKKQASHDLTQHLTKTKETLIDVFGEPIESKPYGKTVRLEYSGKFSGIQGVWSYYVLSDKGYVVSADFTATGHHQNAFFQVMSKNLGEALTIDQLTAEIDSEDRIGQIAAEQIIQNYERGMRVWNSENEDIIYFLNVEGGEDLGYDSLITSVVSIQNYRKKANQKAGFD